MKLQYGWKRKVNCYVCGKPTKLAIHQECGKKLDAEKKATIVRRFETSAISQDQQEKADHNKSKKAYAAGSVPWFCKD